MKTRFTTDIYLKGILNGELKSLSKAITLSESKLAEDRVVASELIAALNPYCGKSIRIAITGSPGVGKSTMIESLGNYFTGLGKKVAVLAIDPTSPLNKGSILGDKTRMESLSNNPLAYVRPSPTNLYLGGTTSTCREAIVLCEAAGFEIILIETVGVGQSETLVKNMVDFFLLLVLPGSGDELQGMKKGIMEMADVILITKADGENIKNAEKSKKEIENALHFTTNINDNQLQVKALTCSVLNNNDVKKIADLIFDSIENRRKTGFFEKNRQNQKIDWMHELIKKSLIEDFYNNHENKKAIEMYEEQLKLNLVSPTIAAKNIINKIK